MRCIKREREEGLRDRKRYREGERRREEKEKIRGEVRAGELLVHFGMWFWCQTEKMWCSRKPVLMLRGAVPLRLT